MEEKKPIVFKHGLYSRGIVIPSGFCKDMGINYGDVMEFKRDGKELTIKKVEG